MVETKIGKANRLSKRADWKIGTEKDNENQIFIKDNWICSIQEVIVEKPEVELLEKIKKVRSKNEDVVSSRGNEKGKSKGVIGKWVADKRRSNIKEEKSICTKRWGIESGSSLVTL